MSNLKKYSIIGLLIVFFTTCNQKEYVVTETGLKYLKVKEGGKERPKDGEFLMLNVSYSNDKDSILFSSAKRGGALPLKYIDSLFTNNGSLEESFKLCNKGDSLILKIPAETIFKESFKRALPDTIDAKSIITVNIGVQDIFNKEQFQTYWSEREKEAKAKAEKEAEEQVVKDAKIIEDYLIEKGIEAQSTPEGLYYVITKKGVGKQPNKGQKVFVTYTGRLLDGTLFDTSIEEEAKAANVYNEGRTYAPYSFLIGEGQVIKGWDIGISLLNKGAKATLYIPSSLAYGPRGAGANIPPNSVLMFDVELLKFE